MLNLVVNKVLCSHVKKTCGWSRRTDPHTLKLCSMWWQIKKSLGFKGYNFKAFWRVVIIYPKSMSTYLSTINRCHKFWISTTNIVEYIRTTQMNHRATLLSTHTTKPNRGKKLIFFSKRPGELWDPHSTLFNSHSGIFPSDKSAVACCSSPFRAEAKNKWSYSYTSPPRLHGVRRYKFTFANVYIS